MMEYKKDIEISITEYLQANRNGAIKGILDILDVSDISLKYKKKLRQKILDEVNNMYNVSCRVLTYIQEKDNGV